MMKEEIIYTVDKNPDGSLGCCVLCPINEDGDLPLEVSKQIRRMLNLGIDEEPEFEVIGKGKIKIRKKER